MIVVRNVFRLKFGKAREAVALFKENLARMRAGGAGKDPRILTDLTGAFYTVVLEMSFDSLADWEAAGRKMMGDAEWKAWYEKVTPLVESGSREIYSVVS